MDFANRSVQQFPDSTNHYTTLKKSLQITNPKLIVNRLITATTGRRFHSQVKYNNFPFLGFRFSFLDSRFWIHISQVSLFESHGSGGATSFDYEQLKCLRIIAQSRFWKFLELRTATFLTRIRIVQFGHPKKLTGTTMTESIRKWIYDWKYSNFDLMWEMVYNLCILVKRLRNDFRNRRHWRWWVVLKSIMIMRFRVDILDLLGLLEIGLIVGCWWLSTEPRFSSIFLPFLVNQTQKQQTQTQTSARIQTQTQQSIFSKPRKLKSKQSNQTQTQIWPHPPILSC